MRVADRLGVQVCRSAETRTTPAGGIEALPGAAADDPTLELCKERENAVEQLSFFARRIDREAQHPQEHAPVAQALRRQDCVDGGSKGAIEIEDDNCIAAAHIKNYPIEDGPLGRNRRDIFDAYFIAFGLELQDLAISELGLLRNADIADAQRP